VAERDDLLERIRTVRTADEIEDLQRGAEAWVAERPEDFWAIGSGMEGVLMRQSAQQDELRKGKMPP
jgi:hypothetical protein